MKKLIIILLMFVGSIFAQNSDKGTVYEGTNDLLFKIIQSTLESMRVNIIGDSTSLTTSIISIRKVNAGTVDTLSRLSNSGDSLNTMAGYYNRGWGFTIATDDTIEFSRTASFTEGQVFELLPGESYTSSKRSITNFTNLFFRRKVISGETGSPIVRIITWGD